MDRRIAQQDWFITACHPPMRNLGHIENGCSQMARRKRIGQCCVRSWLVWSQVLQAPGHLAILERRLIDYVHHIASAIQFNEIHIEGPFVAPHHGRYQPASS